MTFKSWVQFSGLKFRSFIKRNLSSCLISCFDIKNIIQWAFVLKRSVRQNICSREFNSCSAIKKPVPQALALSSRGPFSGLNFRSVMINCDDNGLSLSGLCLELIHGDLKMQDWSPFSLISRICDSGPGFYTFRSYTEDTMTLTMYKTMISHGGVLSEGHGRGGPGVCLGDGQTEAEGVPS